MRQATKQVKLALDPSQDLLVGHQELDIAQAPQVTNSETTQVSKEAGIGDQNGYKEVEDQGNGPGRDVVRTKSKVRVLLERLDGLGSQEKEDPDTCALDSGVGVEDELLNQGIASSRKKAEWACEEEQSRKRTILGLEAFQKGSQSEDVDDHVDEANMKQGKRIQSVH